MVKDSADSPEPNRSSAKLRAVAIAISELSYSDMHKLLFHCALDSPTSYSQIPYKLCAGAEKILQLPCESCRPNNMADMPNFAKPAYPPGARMLHNTTEG